ncbi:MAG TPA: hypothetical protein VGH90_06215 [Chthoniobacteraceae bacterium]
MSERGHNRALLTPEREAVRRAKIKAKLRLTANTTGLLIGQSAPSQIPTGIGNPNSKRWILRDPAGILHECFGLRSWAKANVDLFGWFDPTHTTPPHLIILQRLSVVASGKAEHFRDWTVLERDGLPLDLHLAAVAKVRAAARERKVRKRREESDSKYTAAEEKHQCESA